MRADVQNTLSLKSYLKTHHPDLTDKLEIFIAIARQIASIHAQDIIHNDITPETIRIHIATKAIKVPKSDLSRACSKKGTPSSHTGQIQGQIAYISPEQTGRTAHPIDFRSDYYSLGAVFYEALTGKVPFDYANPMDTIHAHIAVLPVPVHEIDPHVPEILSDIVLKLLCKHSDDRYQSMAGLIADLATSLEHLKTNGEIAPFALASYDISPRFEIPQKLYGRHNEIKRLLDEYQRVKHGEVGSLFFCGPPGIGKSFLVNESLSFLVKAGGCFGVGKFDPHENAVPYSAVSQAFTGLVSHILTLDQKKFEQRRQQILTAVGDNGQFVIDLIPELERVIGKQPTVDESPSLQEGQNRFRYVFNRFVRAIAGADHPAILFIDDLQWADSASIQLLEAVLLDFELSHLLFVGAFRDVEAEENPLFKKFLSRLMEKNPQSKPIPLHPIHDDDVGMLLGDILSDDMDLDNRLTKLIMDKTNGNPLFVREFLVNLHNEGLIRCIQNEKAPHQNRWHIDIEGVPKAELPNTIVALLTARINKMPDNAQNMLKIAACIGTAFCADLLTRINGQPMDEGISTLKQIRNQGLILETQTGFQFIHDRVKEAVYALNTPEERMAIHYAIGTALLSERDETDPNNDVFTVAYQLNTARSLLSQEECALLIELNMKAGEKAKQIVAYTAASDYFEAAITFLEKNSWQTHYDLALAIHTKAAETAFLSADFGRMQQLVSVVLQNARTFIDQVQVHEIRIRALFAQNQPLEAVREGLQVLKKFGYEFPVHPTTLHVIWGFIKASWSLNRRSMKELSSLKDMHAPEMLLAGRIMQIVGYCALHTDLKLFMLFVYSGIKMSLLHGQSSETASGFAMYGVTLCARTPFIDTGYRFGQLALTLAERSYAKPSKAITLFLFNSMILHWKCHLRESFKPLLDTYTLAMETGNIEVAFSTITQYLCYLAMAGEPLKVISQHITHYNEVIRPYDHTTSMIYNNMLHQHVRNLMAYQDAPVLLQGPLYDEEKMVPLHITAGDELALCRLHGSKMALNYVFGNYFQAIQNMDENLKHLQHSMGAFDTPFLFFYGSLSRLALLGMNVPGLSLNEKRSHLKKVSANQKKMKLWARHAPMNFLNKWALVEAERAKFHKQEDQALKYYHQAIELSKTHQYLQEEAISNERLADYYLTQKDQKNAKRHFLEAFTLYQKWGAEAKCRQLERDHDTFFPKRHLNVEANTGVEHNRSQTAGSGLNSNELDMQLFMAGMDKTSDPGCGKDHFHRICESLMKYSGARRVLLLLHREGTLSIGLDYCTGKEAADNRTGPQVGSGLFPETIIHYVMRTKESLVLDHALKAARFENDPYIQKHGARSVLCMPLWHKDSITAILYLENNLHVGLFMPHHLKTIKGLCSHIPLLIENTSLKESVSADTKQPVTPEQLMRSLQHHYGLTPQEAKVASLLKEGYNRSQVRETLNISYNTLKRHLLVIYDKTLGIEEEFSGEGRVDKLSRLILFLFKHEEGMDKNKII